MQDLAKRIGVAAPQRADDTAQIECLRNSVAELEAAADATTTMQRRTTTACVTTPFNKAARDACAGKPVTGCAPEVLSDGAGALDMVACCGDFFIYGKNYSVNSCAMQTDLALLKAKAGL